MLKVKAVTTDTIRIEVDGPGFSGFFIGEFKIRTKPENEALLQKHLNAPVEDGENADEKMLREIYTSFSDLPLEEGQDGFDYICKGPLSAYLAPAAVQAYFDQYQKARRGNSRGSRGR